MSNKIKIELTPRQTRAIYYFVAIVLETEKSHMQKYFLSKIAQRLHSKLLQKAEKSKMSFSLPEAEALLNIVSENDGTLLDIGTESELKMLISPKI